MKRFTNLCLAACLMTTLLAVGCQSPGMITRGQSPAPFPEMSEVQRHPHSTPQAMPKINSVEHAANPDATKDKKVVQTAHQSPHEKKQAVVDAIQDIYHEKHNTSVTYSSESQYAGSSNSCPNGGCPQGGYGDYSYHGGFSGHGGGFCPQGHYGYGNDLNHYPTHRFSQSYKVPNDLSYPAQNAVGGAVVYPYYTHKGPSDFFRAK